MAKGLSNTFARYFLLGVLVSVPILGFLTNLHWHLRNLPGQEFMKRYGSDMFDPGTDSDGKLRSRREFWIADAGNGRRVALRLLDSPKLFDSFFPGYGEARGDQELWSKYFGEGSFDSSVESPVFAESHGYMLATSFFGNAEIFSKYGGDVLVIGPSRTQYAVIPALLSQELGEGLRTSPKVLLLGSHFLNPRQLLRLGDELSSRGRRAKVAVIGYSMDWPLRRTLPLPTRPLGIERRPAESESAWSRLLSVPKQAAADFEWRKLLRDKVLDDDCRVNGEPPLQFGTEWFFFPASYGANAPALDSLAERITKIPEIFRFQPASPSCDIDWASKQLDTIISKMKGVADHVVLFVSPETPQAWLHYPPCFVPAVVKMLKSKKSDYVSTLIIDWKTLGLGYTNYLFASRFDDDQSLVDYHHVNYSGALKTTKALADALRPILRAGAR